MKLVRLKIFCLFLLHVHGQVLVKCTIVHGSKKFFWIEAAPFNGAGTVIQYLRIDIIQSQVKASCIENYENNDEGNKIFIHGRKKYFFEDEAYFAAWHGIL